MEQSLILVLKMTNLLHLWIDMYKILSIKSSMKLYETSTIWWKWNIKLWITYCTPLLHRYSTRRNMSLNVYFLTMNFGRELIANRKVCYIGDTIYYAKNVPVFSQTCPVETKRILCCWGGHNFIYSCRLFGSNLEVVVVMQVVII